MRPEASIAPVVSSAPARIPSLDGLRAISIAMVLLAHCSNTMHVSTATLHWLWVPGNGGMGVSMFFAISGFLITTLLIREQLRSGSIGVRDFYIRRAFRIFPAFYAYWAVVVSLALQHIIELPVTDLLSSGFYVWNYIPHHVDTWFMGHTWSLCVEEQFYFLWPLLLIWLGLKRARVFALAILFAEPFLRIATYFLWTSARPRIGLMLHTRADALMAGALLALFAADPRTLGTVRQVANSRIIPWCFPVVLLADHYLELRFHGAYLLSVGYSIQSLFIALFIAHVVFCSNTHLGKLLNTRFLVHIGAISYSLYLWQQLFLTVKAPLSLGRFRWNLAFAFIAAECSYFLIEKQFLRLRDRFFSSRQPILPNYAEAATVAE